MSEYPTVAECLELSSAKSRGYICVKSLGATAMSPTESFGIIYLKAPLTVHVRQLVDSFSTTSATPAMQVTYDSMEDLMSEWEVD